MATSTLMQLLNYEEHCICKLGKILTELRLLSGVYYLCLNCMPESFDTVTSIRMGFHDVKAAAGLGLSVLRGAPLYWVK